MSNLSLKRSLSQIFIGIIVGLILIFASLYITGLWKKWFGPDKVEVINQKQGSKDTLTINSQPERTIGSENIQEPNQAKEKKPTILQSSSPEIKQQNTPLDVINRSAKGDIAVIAITNGKKDNELAAVFVNWLMSYKPASQSILLNSFIELGLFNQIIEGNSSIILNTNANQAAKYICLIKSSVDYSKSSAVEGLIFADCFYDFMIIETQSGNIVDSFFNHNESSSDRSEQKAKKRTETFLSDFLSKRKLTI